MSEYLPTKGISGYLFDGFGSLDGGVNTGISPTIKSALVPHGLDRNQVANATNCTMRGGSITHRFCYVQRPLSFGSDVDPAQFKTGLFQGASFYESREPSLVVSISGRLFQVRISSSYTVKDISTPDLNPDNRNLAWFCQMGPFLVVQDGASKPWIFNGAATRRATDQEIKPGTVMAYSAGRIWYATANGYSFRATDLVGNTQTGTIQYGFLDSGLLETENQYLNEGGDFIVPPTSGGIRSMIAPNMLDTSLGQGPLQVFTERGAFSVNAPFDRTQWKSVNYPIQTESQIQYGALGARNTVNVNGDIFYRSLDGIRSFELARADFKTWLNTPVSQEVMEILNSDNDQLLYWGSAINFNNRLIMTCYPRPTAQGITHDGLVTLDFNLVTSLRDRAPAAWEGALTGLSVLQLVKGVCNGKERAFAFVLSTAGEIELWEIVEPGVGDELSNGTKSPILWSFETPAYDFRRAEALKRLVAAALWIEDVQGQTEFVLQFKPDRYPCWVDWYRWSECAPIEQCFDRSKGCRTIHNYKPQYRPKVKIPQPPELCNMTVGSLFKDGYEFAFRLQVTGHAVVKKMRFACLDQGEKLYDDCQPVGPCLPLECCFQDPLSYRIPGQGVPTAGTLPPGYPPPSYPGFPDAYPSYPAPPPPAGPGQPQEPGEPGLPPTDQTVPVVDGWVGDWNPYPFSSQYYALKITNDPNADIPANLRAYMQALIANEWAANPPQNWHERILAWEFVDPMPADGYYGDAATKMADGDPPIPENGDPLSQFLAGWRLAYLWR